MYNWIFLCRIKIYTTINKINQECKKQEIHIELSTLSSIDFPRENNRMKYCSERIIAEFENE